MRRKKELDEKAKKETKAKADAMLGKVTGEESFKEQALANASRIRRMIIKGRGHADEEYSGDPILPD